MEESTYRGAIDLGLVVPAYNESENLPILLSELVAVLAGSGLRFEILVVDDGSTDGTAELIRKHAAGDERVAGLILSRNFGHQAAISVGLTYVRGNAIGIMDGDLQDKPADVLRLYHALKAEKADVAYGVRATRSEGLVKRTSYRAFYKLLSRLATISIPLDAGDFCVMTRQFVDKLNSLPERLRFVRGLRSWIGGRQVPVMLDRDPRKSGVPKYTLRKLVRLAMDGLISFSDVPLRIASVVGFFVSGMAGLGIVVVLAWKASGRLPQGAAVATIALSILFLGGVQLLTAGILGEYVGRIFDEVKRRPIGVVAEVVGGAVSHRPQEPHEVTPAPSLVPPE